MRVAIIANPIAGGGRGAAIQDRLAVRAAAMGWEPLPLRTVPGGVVGGSLGGADRAIVVGGDGTVRIAAPLAAEAGVPLCVYPTGTENLFARTFGMVASIEEVVARCAGSRSCPIDLAMANGEPCLAMASVGFDAAVVRDVAARRRGPITKRVYLSAISRLAMGWRAPRFSVEVDGRVVAAGVRGFVVVGNLPAYAARLDPARGADPSDGLLDACVMPCRTALGVAVWAGRLWIARIAGKRANSCRVGRGRVIRVLADEPFLHQVDGDAPRDPGPVGLLEIHILDRPLLVLGPPQDGVGTR